MAFVTSSEQHCPAQPVDHRAGCEIDGQGAQEPRLGDRVPVTVERRRIRLVDAGDALRVERPQARGPEPEQHGVSGVRSAGQRRRVVGG